MCDYLSPAACLNVIISARYGLLNLYKKTLLLFPFLTGLYFKVQVVNISCTFMLIQRENLLEWPFPTPRGD
jgi:hypothetical protein